MSRALAPKRPVSSATENTTSMRGRGVPAARTCRRPSKMAHTPEMSSAARMVVPSEYSTPSFSTGLMPRPLGTRSMWELRNKEPFSSPSRTAMTLPHSPPKVSPALSRVTVKPRASIFSVSLSAMAFSLPAAESVVNSSISSLYILSFFMVFPPLGLGYHGVLGFK